MVETWSPAGAVWVEMVRGPRGWRERLAGSHDHDFDIAG